MMSTLDVPATCPACGARDVAVILYGEPVDAGATVRQFAPTPVIFGGCVVGASSPRWRCRACDHAWGRRSEEPAV